MDERTQEQRASDELVRTLSNKLDGHKAIDIAAMAAVQSQTANAALQGLIELLVHKNVIAAHELAPALRHAYNRATDKLTNRQSPIVLPDTVLARPQ